MKNKFALTTFAAGLALAASNVQAEVPLALDVHAGTLGGGVGLTIGVREKLNVRIGGSFFSYSTETEGEDDNPNDGVGSLEYDGDLDLSNGHILADWHPFSGGFRLSGGLLLNGNEFSAAAQCNQNQCEVGDQTFEDDDLGRITAATDFDSVAPYLGIGWGNAVAAGSPWGFQAELGVVFQGEANIQLNQEGGCQGTVGTVQGQAACRAQVRAELDREQNEINDDLDEFDIYPLLSIGISYRFR